jgi:hypothetical protein
MNKLIISGEKIPYNMEKNHAFSYAIARNYSLKKTERGPGKQNILKN